jgi:predicted nucleic acid-binding protein
VTRFVLDTNVYIEAARNRTKAEELEAFASAALPFLFLHVIAAQEMLAGAVTADSQRDIQRGLIKPFERRNRILTPSSRAWLRSGEIVAELVRSKRLSRSGVKPSFLNDALIAASCREAGLTLITNNTADFEKISSVEPVRFVEPWPGL